MPRRKLQASFWTHALFPHKTKPCGAFYFFSKIFSCQKTLIQWNHSHHPTSWQQPNSVLGQVTSNNLNYPEYPFGMGPLMWYDMWPQNIPACQLSFLERTPSPYSCSRCLQLAMNRRWKSVLGNQLHWISSIHSTKKVGVVTSSPKVTELPEHVLCGDLKCSCYKNDMLFLENHVVTWTGTPLQWNGCCLATNAKEEPNSLPPSLPPHPISFSSLS